MSGEAIRTEGLSKRFGDVLAVDGLDLSVRPGEIFGFLGPNGAGKTTTIRLLLHLLRPSAGRAWLMGVPTEDVEAAHRHVGYVPGEVALWPQRRKPLHPPVQHHVTSIDAVRGHPSWRQRNQPSVRVSRQTVLTSEPKMRA